MALLLPHRVLRLPHEAPLPVDDERCVMNDVDDTTIDPPYESAKEMAEAAGEGATAGDLFGNSVALSANGEELAIGTTVCPRVRPQGRRTPYVLLRGRMLP